MNDEGGIESRISDVLSKIAINNPEIIDKFKKQGSKEQPYYLTYVELIKKHNPDIWPRFLTMLYKSIIELETKIKRKGV